MMPVDTVNIAQIVPQFQLSYIVIRQNMIQAETKCSECLDLQTKQYSEDFAW